MSATGRPASGRRARHGALLALSAGAAIASPYAPPVAGGVLVVLLGILWFALLPALAPGRASRDAPRLWGDAARAAWVTGALAVVLLFVRALVESEHGIEAIATAMALAFAPGILALAVAGMALAFAFRLPAAAEASAPVSSPSAPNTRLGRLLFVGLLIWMVLAAHLEARGGPFHPRDYLLHGPAVLVVTGAAIALALLLGRAWRRLAPTALALAGTLGALAGLVQALLGMARVSIAHVAAGLQSVTTTCFVTLVALALLTPAAAEELDDDRAATARTANAVAYVLFPLLSLLLLAIAFVMVITPMTKSQ